MKPDRAAVKVDFPKLAWVKVEGGGAVGRVKRHVPDGGLPIRILEMDPKWNETEWCSKPHTGYVLSGRLRLDFEGGVRLDVEKGEGFWIPKGCAHKASCRRVTRMFIVG